MDRRTFLGGLGAAVAGGSALAGGRLPVLGGGPREAEADGVAAERLQDPGTGTRRIIWSVRTDERAAALTFDDGPDPEFTPRILDILDSFGVKSTFMVMGFNAVRHAGLVADLVTAGHEVGNHTWSHRNLGDLGPRETLDEIVRGSDAVRAVTGTRTTLLRPPRGEFTADVIRGAAVLDHDLMLWSVTRGAPTRAAPAEVADAVASRLGPGDIVDLHDGLGRGTFNPGAEFTERLRHRREVEVAALPEVLRRARHAGLRLVTASELLGFEGAGRPT